MTIMKRIQCDWCFKEGGTGKTMVYKMNSDAGNQYEYQKELSSCEFRYEENTGYTTKHICKKCIDDISPPTKSYKSKNKSAV